MKRETKDCTCQQIPQFPICHRVFHQCLPIASSRARLRALLCYVMLCLLVSRASVQPTMGSRAVQPLLRHAQFVSSRAPRAPSFAKERSYHVVASTLHPRFLHTGRLAPSPLLLARRPLCTPASELVTTRSGLMYRDVSVPEGARGPNTGDTVRVHYTGRLEALAATFSHSALCPPLSACLLSTHCRPCSGPLRAVSRWLGASSGASSGLLYL